MSRLRLLSIPVVLAVTGCAVGPDYRPAPPSALGVPDRWSVADTTVPPDLVQWWTRFDDPLLVDLIARAEVDNLDIGQAVARLRQAREALVQSRAALLPTLSASGSYSRNVPLRGGARTVTLPDGTVTTVQTGANDNFSIGADASYQLDLFGGVRRSVEGSRALLDATAYDLATTRLAIQAEVARNYLIARTAQAQLANARSSLALQDDNLEIAGFRVQAGLVSSLDAEQARQQRAQTAATIPTFEANLAAAVARLGVLTGQAPGYLRPSFESRAPIPQPTADIGIGVPLDTLRQRPDVRAAERRLAAATAQIGVAEAQLYPQLFIGGSVDSNATSFDQLFDIINGRLFGQIAQTIFDGGRLRAQVRSQRAAADAAFLSYKQTVLTGLEDVENAVVALRSADARVASFTEALDAARNFAILSRSQYRAGLTDFTTLNQAESALLSAGNGLVQAQGDRASAIVQLMSALGGGWDAGAVPAIPDTPPPAAVTQE